MRVALARSLARGSKYASRKKIESRGASAFVTRSQPLEASRENAYVYGECTSGALHLNTPRLIADSTGTTVWRWDQGEPFGNDVPNNNPSGAGAFEFNLRFPGQYFDRETNLAYNLLRDFDPSIGRYIQSDPISLDGGMNTYAYVEGDPITSTDPDGLSKRGGGNPRTSNPNTWQGQQGAWYRGQFYPRLGPTPVASTPRTAEAYCPAAPGYPSLPRDLPSTLGRITSGQRFPHRNDGSEFRNDQGLLPPQPPGYYREYVHPTDGVTGIQRVVTGLGGEIYYSPNHYGSFIRVNP